MRKKILVPMMFMTMCMAGCANVNTVTPTETETTVAETTMVAETETEMDAASESDVESEMTGDETTVKSYGTYMGTEQDANGEDVYAVFMDVHGNEFIAVLNDELELPDMLEGEYYEIEHDDMVTMSIPPQYPQVKSINVSSLEEMEANSPDYSDADVVKDIMKAEEMKELEGAVDIELDADASVSESEVVVNSEPAAELDGSVETETETKAETETEQK